jgi:hypothetical protein
LRNGGSDGLKGGVNVGRHWTASAVSLYSEKVMIRVALIAASLGFSGAVNTVPMKVSSAREKPDIENSWTPVAFTLFDSCLGEFIFVSGQAHTTTRTFDEGERLRIKGHTNLSLTGVGLTTGAGVHLQQVSNEDFEMELPGGAGQTDQVFHLILVSAGKAPNSHITTNGTMHFDGHGGTQFVAKKAESACR